MQSKGASHCLGCQSGGSPSVKIQRSVRGGVGGHSKVRTLSVLGKWRGASVPRLVWGNVHHLFALGVYV